MSNLIGSPTPMSQIRTRLVLTRIPDSWRWARTDILVRLLPFVLAYAAAHRLSGGAAWLGWSVGDVRAQLLFAAVGVPGMFVAAMAGQPGLVRGRWLLQVPAPPGAPPLHRRH